MEAVLVMIIPLALLGLGWYITYRYFPPFRLAQRLLLRILRWLWRDRTPRGGAGRLRHPRIWYDE